MLMPMNLVADKFEHLVKGLPKREWDPKGYRFLDTWLYRPLLLCLDEPEKGLFQAEEIDAETENAEV